MFQGLIDWLPYNLGLFLSTFPAFQLQLILSTSAASKQLDLIFFVFDPPQDRLNLIEKSELLRFCPKRRGLEICFDVFLLRSMGFLGFLVPTSLLPEFLTIHGLVNIQKKLYGSYGVGAGKFGDIMRYIMLGSVFVGVFLRMVPR